MISYKYIITAMISYHGYVVCGLSKVFFRYFNFEVRAVSASKILQFKNTQHLL